MMSKESNEQSVSHGDAYQARGDMHIQQGLSAEHVETYCLGFWHKNFPELRDAAKEESRQAVEEFGGKLYQTLSGLSSKIDELEEKLASPDVQASVNDSVMYVAKTTRYSDMDTLCRLLSNKFSEEIRSQQSILAGEAIRLLDKLNSDHLRLIGLLRFFSYYSMQGRTDISGLEKANMMDAEIYMRFMDLEKNTGITVDYLSYAGVLTSSYTMISSRAPQMLKEVYDLNIGASEKFSDEKCSFKNYFPLTTKIFKALGIYSLVGIDAHTFTIAGTMLADSYLDNFGP